MGLFSWGKQESKAQPSTSGELVTFERNGNINIHVRTAVEAKLALKHLRLRRKELSLVKRQVTAQEQAVRAQYTDQTRRQAPKMRGGGGLGFFIRNVQTGARAAKRKELAKHLLPMEQSKQHVDAMIAGVDKAILRVESYIITESA